MSAVTTPSPAGSAARQSPRAVAWRRAAFGILATFILLGPAPGQLFGLHSMLLREWVMFSGAGVGLLKGRFTLHRADGTVTLTPLEAAGLSSYLELPIARRPYQAADLKTFAARICGDARPAERVSFEGSIGTFSGWSPLNVADVCNAPAQVQAGGGRS